MESSSNLPFRTQLLKLISESNTAGACQQIKKVFRRVKEFENELALIESRLNSLKDAKSRGTISRSEGDLDKNKINNDLILFFDRVEDELEGFISFKKIQISQKSLEEQLNYKLGDNYELFKVPLGEGGTSIIYKATQVFSGKPVAVRALKNQEFVKKEKEEIIFNNLNLEDQVKRHLQIKHRNIIKVIEFFLEDFPACYIEEFVDGPNLKRLLEKFGAFPTDRVFSIIYQLSKALYYLHSMGIIHKRLRPSKVFIDTEGIPVITPFQELTNSFNTANLQNFHFELKYLSPEELLGNSPDDQSDQFALGLLAYELLSGEALFKGNNIMEVLNYRNQYFKSAKYRNDLFEKLDIPEKLRSTIKKMLASNPAKRFRSVKEAGDVFRRYYQSRDDDYYSIVEYSFIRCRTNNPNFSRDFYINLFAHHPDLIHYFYRPTTTGQQKDTEHLKEFKADLELYKKGTIQERKKIIDTLIIPKSIRTPFRMLKDVISLIWVSNLNLSLLTDIVKSKDHQNVTAEQFQLFLDNFIDTASQNDYLWDNKIENAWKEIMNGIMAEILKIVGKEDS